MQGAVEGKVVKVGWKNTLEVNVWSWALFLKFDVVVFLCPWSPQMIGNQLFPLTPVVQNALLQLGKLDGFSEPHSFIFLCDSLLEHDSFLPFTLYLQFLGLGWVTSSSFVFLEPWLILLLQMLGFSISSLSGFKMLTYTEQPLLKVRLGQLFLFKRVVLFLLALWDIFMHPAQLCFLFP